MVCIKKEGHPQKGGMGEAMTPGKHFRGMLAFALLDFHSQFTAHSLTLGDLP